LGQVTVYPGGSSASFPSGSRHLRAKRGVIKGWTAAAARRMLMFLWSVDADALTGKGFAVTLTMGGRPNDSVSWAAARDLLVQWLRDHGSIRHQWLTEWTKQGRPHLHLCVYGDSITPEDLALAWLKISRKAGWPAEWKGQHVELLYDSTGWLKYVAKHSARGVDHYQRTDPPEGWETTGRLWGKGGDWPRHEPFTIRLSTEQTWAYMGLFRSWQAARMRSEGVPEDIVRAYEVGPAGPLSGGEPRGLSGWIPAYESAKLLLQVSEFPDGDTEPKELML